MLGNGHVWFGGGPRGKGLPAQEPPRRAAYPVDAGPHRVRAALGRGPAARIGDDEVAFVVSVARMRPKKLGLPFTHWSLRKLAGYVSGRSATWQGSRAGGASRSCVNVHLEAAPASVREASARGALCSAARDAAGGRAVASFRPLPPRRGLDWLRRAEAGGEATARPGPRAARPSTTPPAPMLPNGCWCCLEVNIHARPTGTAGTRSPAMSAVPAADIPGELAQAR